MYVCSAAVKSNASVFTTAQGPTSTCDVLFPKPLEPTQLDTTARARGAIRKVKPRHVSVLVFELRGVAHAELQAQDVGPQRHLVRRLELGPDG